MLFYRKSRVVVLLASYVCICVFFTGCTISSYEYENDSAVYRSQKLPFKVYMTPSQELKAENPTVYQADCRKEASLRQNLVKRYPELFTISKTGDAITVQYATRWFSKESSGRGWKFLSFLTLGFFPYVYEEKHLHRMDFILPDGTKIQHPFYRINRQRGALGILALLQLFRFSSDLKITTQDPYEDPVFLSIFADGISSFGTSILIKAFNSTEKSPVVFLEEGNE